MSDPQGPNGTTSDGPPNPSEALRDLLEEHVSGGDDAQSLALCPICRAADVLRATAPDELRDQWQVVQRDALLTMKALVDHAVERLDDEPADTGPRVQDIPIS